MGWSLDGGHLQSLRPDLLSTHGFGNITLATVGANSRFRKTTTPRLNHGNPQALKLLALLAFECWYLSGCLGVPGHILMMHSLRSTDAARFNPTNCSWPSHAEASYNSMHSVNILSSQKSLGAARGEDSPCHWSSSHRYVRLRRGTPTLLSGSGNQGWLLANNVDPPPQLARAVPAYRRQRSTSQLVLHCICERALIMPVRGATTAPYIVGT